MWNIETCDGYTISFPGHFMTLKLEDEFILNDEH